MAEDDARANVLKSLGVRRRGAAADAATDAPEDEAAAADDAADADEGDDDPGPAVDTTPEDAPAEPKAVSGLGIKRRQKAEPEAAGDEGDAKAGGGGLGLKRRKPGAEPEPEAEAAPAKPTRKLGNDEASVLLAKYFRTRPTVELPPRVFELKRTHGFYSGDGRAERKLFVGFEPALVLYILPVYPEEIYPEFTKDHKPIDPGLHRQPKFVKDGFIVDEPFNRLGDGYMYVAFRSDGEPLELPDATPAEPEKPRVSGLGIKRRK